MSTLHSEGQASPLSLQAALHGATRKQHMQLNQTITARLPLCLPPCSSDPLAYTVGMTLFGQIYFAFEDAWISILESKNEQLCTRQKQLLKRLQTQKLSRTQRLRHDLTLLKQRLSPAQVHLVAQIEEDSTRFNQRIQNSIQIKPHTTLAYAWTMYLALFNGGRWLLRQLSQPGPDFWLEDTETTKQFKIDALSFWYFDSPSENAEDIKMAFKANFDHAADLLTPEERADVVAESIAIFDICAEMVEYLDYKLSAIESGTASVSSQTAMIGLTFTDLFKPFYHIWQSLNSTASAYLPSRVPQPLREEVRATQ